jgi:acyl-[acyl-carrier-protein] desaturase
MIQSEKQLINELNPAIEFLLDRHIATSKKWNPHEYIPWERGSRLATEGFLYGENSIPDNLKSSFIINLLTEDSLPWYSRTLSEVFGRESVVGEWIHRWTAEEARHSYVLRSYITLSGIMDPVKLEQDRIAFVSTGRVPELVRDKITNDYLDGYGVCQSFAYTTIQELSARSSYFNMAQQLDDKAGYEILKRVLTDENYHFLFYRDAVMEILKIDPSSMMVSLSKVIMQFEMPGVGAPGYAQHARNISDSGIYSIRSYYEDVLMPILKHWNIFNITGLNSMAEQSRDDLIKFLTRLKKIIQRKYGIIYNDF